MPERENAWAPVLAERERSATVVAASFPCRGSYNRYLGCVGARKCRASGVSMCVLGRWPDEHAAAGRARRAYDEPAAAAPRPLPARQATAPREEFVASVAPSPARDTDKPAILVVQPDRRASQVLSKQIAAAGYEALWFTTGREAAATLRDETEVAAVLVDGSIVAGMDGSDEMFDLCADGDIPVLRLPGGHRDAASVETMARMTVLWLAVTLNSAHQDGRRTAV